MSPQTEEIMYRYLFILVFASTVLRPADLIAAEQVQKQKDPNKTIFNLLYLRKFKPALSLLKSLSPDSPYHRDLYMGVQSQILVYEEKWNEIIQLRVPSEIGTFGKTLVFIAKGMAHAHKQDMQQAIEHIKLINELKSSKDYKEFKKEIDFSSLFLSGYTRLRQRKFHNTLRLFKRSVKIEEKFANENAYSWVYNALFYLGLTYEISARKHEAVARYKKVLERWPNMERAALKIKEINI